MWCFTVVFFLNFIFQKVAILNQFRNGNPLSMTSKVFSSLTHQQVFRSLVSEAALQYMLSGYLQQLGKPEVLPQCQDFKISTSQLRM